MTTNADIGFGTQFKRGDGNSPESFVAIAEVTGGMMPDLSKDAVDATHHRSPNRYREFISGLRDGGEIEVVANFVPGSSDVDDMFTDYNADAARNYQIVWTDGSEFEFSGILIGLSMDPPLDDKMSVTMRFKVSGQPTYTAA